MVCFPASHLHQNKSLFERLRLFTGSGWQSDPGWHLRSREKDPGDISSQNIADELKKLGKEVFYFHSFDEIEKFILENLVHGDLIDN